MNSSDSLTSLPTVRLCVGAVSHLRLRPARNAFRYGLYFLRLPVRTMNAGKTAHHCRWFSHNRFNLLSFFDKDHGDGKSTSTAWIDQLLQAEKIVDATGEIWLQCFPRVLGYVFNPVAFWFCHRTDGSLRAIVCEVRNTFGEKHIYLLDHGKEIKNGERLHTKKIFHVSPFCRIEGQYRFRFLQKTSTQNGVTTHWHIAKIDYDDAQGPVLLTSIAGTECALSDRKILALLFGYPMMTVGVMLKIHIQALRLFFKRVPFFSKPLPPSKEVSR